MGPAAPPPGLMIAAPPPRLRARGQAQGLQIEDSQLASADRLVKLAAAATKAACTDIQLVGKAKAITATARKIAVLFYNTLRHGMSYVDPGATYHEDRYRQRVLNNLQRRAKSLGFVLHRVEPDTAQVGVS
jgi:hypothetical protein